MEVHGPRRVDGAEARRRGDEARGVPRAAPLQGLPGGDAGRREVLQAQDGRVLGGSGRCPSPAASSTACSTSTGSGSRASSWCSFAAAARGRSPGAWPGRRTRGRDRPPWRRSRRPRWSSPTAGAGSRRPCARPDRAPGSRGAPSTPSRGSSATRRRGRSSRRDAGPTSSRAASWASRRCTGRSSGPSAISTGAGSGPTSRRTGPWRTAGGSTPARGRGGRARRCRRWCRRGRCSPASTPTWPRPARCRRPTA